MSNAKPTRMRGRRLALGLAILALLSGYGSGTAVPAPHSEIASHESVVAASASAGMSTEADAAIVVDAPVAGVPVVAPARPVAVPGVEVSARSADRSATGERAPPRLTR
jgi:hypothetical protein